jgi:regulator of protease activity HflC (stomatin/prohibitin superfamily)
MPGINALTVVFVFLVFLAMSAIKILKEYERGVIFRLGRLVGARGPGIFWLWPIIEKMVKVDLRVITQDVPAQDVITKDNVSVKVNAVVYFRVFDPDKAIVEVEDYLYATSKLAQTTLRSVVGEAELDELLAERERINDRIASILDEGTDPWGIKVAKVEVKDVDLPQQMQRAMARQAEAERERRAKVITAEGESLRVSTRPPEGWPKRPGSSPDTPRRCSSGTCRPWSRSRPRTTRRPCSRSRSISSRRSWQGVEARRPRAVSDRTRR